MKITDIYTHLLEYQLENPIGSSIGLYKSRQALLVEIRTDNNLIGWGEASGWPSSTRDLIETVLRPLLLGRDPMDTNVLWHEMYVKTRHFGQKGIAIAAISGVDIALWDIVGKYLDAPIYKLLGGGFRDEISAYAMGLFYLPNETLTDLQHKANDLVNKRGFPGVKMKVGGLPLKEDSKRVESVREAIGPNALLMVDANRAFNASAAISVGRKLDRYDLFWFEEPVPPEDIEGYCAVKSALPMYIAGGECEFTRFGFGRLFEKRAVDIVQPEICRAGGFTECKRIADMACTAGIFYVPHMHGSALSLASNLQLCAALPPVSAEVSQYPPLIELDTTTNPLRDELLVEPLTFTNGKFKIPDAPGLGVKVNRAMMERFKA